MPEPAPRGLLRRVPPEPVAVVLLVSGAAMWGVTFPTAKDGIDVMGVVSFAFWTRFVGLAVLLPLAPGVPRGEWRRSAPIGALLGVLLYLAYLFQSLGLERTTATNAGFVTGLYVIGTPILAAAWSRHLPSLRIVGALCLSLAGLALLSLRGGTFSAGDSLVLVSALFWSLQILAVGAGAERDPVALIVTELAVASALHLVGAGFQVRAGLLDDVALELFFTGVLGTGVAYFFQVLAQRRISATRTAIVYSSEPLFAALFSWLWLNERLGLRGWVGGLCIVAAMTLVEAGRGSTPRED